MKSMTDKGLGNTLLALGWGVFRAGVFVLCIAGILFYGILMLRNGMIPDFGWLLQSGAYILAHHQIPVHDVFSWSWPDKPWVLYQWLFEVGVAWGHQNLGEQLLMRLFMVLTIACYVIAPICLTPKRVPVLLTFLISVMGLVSASVTLTLRPLIITSVFLLAQYGFLKKYRQQQWSFAQTSALLAILYLLWGNLHMGVTIGLGMLVLMAIGDWLEHQGLYITESPEPLTPIKTYAVFASIGLLASCINPYGFGIYTYLFNLSSQTYLNDLIDELSSPNFHAMGFMLLLPAYLMVPFLLMRKKQVLPARDFMILMVFNLTTLYISRFIVWLCLFASLILPRALYDGWKNTKFSLSEAGLYRYLSLGSLVLGCLVFLAFPQFFPKVTEGECGDYKNGILSYQQLKRPTDRLLNNDVIGSCMIRYTPQQKVFFDTRFDFYTQDFSKQVTQALVMAPGWENFLHQWKINTVLLSKTCIRVSQTCPLIHTLEAENGFKLIYEDPAMVILRN